MQLVRTEMCVTPGHRQTLVPQQIRNIFEWRSLHPQTTRKGVTQVVPMKVLELRFHYSVIKPVATVLKRLARFCRRKDASFTFPALEYRLERTDSRVVYRHVQRLLILGTWNVKLSGLPVYHVPR